MDYRVEELAAVSDLSVDTIRYYQAKGLLAAPRREGRIALYDDDHAERLRTIRALQAKGLSLAVIGRVLDGSLGRADAELAAAVAAAQAAGDDDGLTLDEVAERTGVPTALLRAIERAGLRLGRMVDGVERFGPADVEVVRQGLVLLEAGFPLNELLELGKRYDDAARALAEHAVDLFDEHIREPARDDPQRLVDAFETLLPAVTAIVAHHFRQLLLQIAEERVST